MSDNNSRVEPRQEGDTSEIQAVTASRTPDEPVEPSSLLVSMLYVIAATLVLSLYVSTMINTFPQVSFETALLVFAICMCIFVPAILVFTLYARKGRREYADLGRAHEEMVIYTENLHISDRDLPKVLCQFQPDMDTGKITEKLVYVSKRTRFYLWGPLILITSVTMVILRTLVPLTQHSRTIPLLAVENGVLTTQPFVVARIPFGVVMLVALIAALMILIVWVRWTSVFIVITQVRLIKLTAYPVWFYWLGDDAPEMLIRKIDSKHPRRTMLGKLFGGYGILGPDTAAQNDDPLKLMTGIPRVRVVAGLVGSLQAAA